MSSTELNKLNHRANLTQWQQLVYDCRHSGMTVKAWCAENGVSEKSYYYRQRRKRAKPTLEEFHDWVFALNDAPKSLLGSAVHYTRKLWPWLNNYLLDGRLEISNNRAERGIKPFVMGRKNFLFANVPKGAEASAVIYSLIETAKENGLDPYRYLTWLMHEAPKLDMGANDQVAMLMPVHAPVECRVNKCV